MLYSCYIQIWQKAQNSCFMLKTKTLPHPPCNCCRKTRGASGFDIELGSRGGRRWDPRTTANQYGHDYDDLDDDGDDHGDDGDGGDNDDDDGNLCYGLEKPASAAVSLCQLFQNWDFDLSQPSEYFWFTEWWLLSPRHWQNISYQMTSSQPLAYFGTSNIFNICPIELISRHQEMTPIWGFIFR